jgi:hypothetical protein
MSISNESERIKVKPKASALSAAFGLMIRKPKTSALSAGFGFKKSPVGELRASTKGWHLSRSNKSLVDESHVSTFPSKPI